MMIINYYLEQNLPNKIINPLIINTPEIQRKPKIYKLNIINTETENNNIFMDDENNNNNINNIILSHDDIILPSMIKKDYMTEEDIIEKEKGNLEYISQEILEEYIDITNILMVDEIKDKFSFHEVPELEMKVMVRYSNTNNSTKWAIYDKIEDFNGETLACYHGYSFEYLFEEKFPKSTVVQKGNSFIYYMLFL